MHILHSLPLKWGKKNQPLSFGIHLVFSNLPWLQGRSLGLCLTHGDLGYLSMIVGGLLKLP